MQITKIGHCCLVIEVNGVKLLTDPGMFSTAQNDVVGIDAVIITHEHGDHIHVDSLKAILKNNPEARVITNKGTAKLLDPENIKYELVEDGGSTEVKGVRIEGHGEKHAIIYGDYGQVENTGYFIADKLFYPGDAFHNPGKKVEILALPVAGPWMKMSDAIDYAKDVKPEVAFPVHDAFIKPSGAFYPMFAKILETLNIKFVPMVEGETKEF